MSENSKIQLAHGGGGRLSRDLIQEEILSRFGDGPLKGLPDGATLPPIRGELVFTTDSYVVSPLEFPGGNIGHLAVHGTVNDLSVCGARPQWLSLGLIVEEGLPLQTLRTVLDTIREAADDCGVVVATGDTKVVARGQGDGLYINSSGIGQRFPEFDLSPERIKSGDRILVSGPLGDHGLAVLAAREGIQIENGPQSDTGSVHRLVSAALPYGGGVRFMRDPTRGGAAAVLNEIVEEKSVGIMMDESVIPVSRGARAVAEMLGLDPLHVASEGRVLAVCDPSVSNEILRAWQGLAEGAHAVDMAEVTSDAGRVVMTTLAGGHRLVDVPRGELLPRIC